MGVALAAGHDPAGPASFGGLDLPGIVRADQVHPAARVCLKVCAEVSWGWQKGEAQDFRPTELGCADRNTTACVEGRGQVDGNLDSVLPVATQICIHGGRVEGRGCWWQETEHGKLYAH